PLSMLNQWAKARENMLNSPYQMDVPQSMQRKPPPKQADNWVKCASFQYSDENWEPAAPKRDKKAFADGGGAFAQHPEAQQKTSQMTEKIGGVLGGLISMAIGAFNDVESRVSDLGQASGGFLDTWVKKLKDIAEKVWKP